MLQVLPSEQQRQLLATVWPTDPWSRRACSSVWLAQDLCPVTVPASTHSAPALKTAVPLLPQRFNGPCGLLAALQAEMLLVAAAATGARGDVMSTAVHRMLQRAARSNGGMHARYVTRLLCSACGSSLAASPPADDDNGSGDDGDGSAAAAACSCGCPPCTRLGWSGRLWCTLQCVSCSARSCIDCAQVEYDDVRVGSDDDHDERSHHASDAASNGDSALAHRMTPARTGRGEALLLLYSLVMSAGSALCTGPMIDVDCDQAVGCAAEMVTLALWGVGRVGAAAAADLSDCPDVFKSAAALARGGRTQRIGLLLGSSSIRECHVPSSCEPSVWLALSGGHWRVITNDSRIVELPPSPQPATSSRSHYPSSVGFHAVQFDGLPRSKTHGLCASITFFTVEHTPQLLSTAALPLPPPLLSASLPLARIIGRRYVHHIDAHAKRQLHVVWESGHAAEAAMPAPGPPHDDVDKWYCRRCFFANERESVTCGDATWRNCFNAAAASACKSCSEDVSACGRSMWLDEDALAGVCADMVSAYDDAAADLLELALRGRWRGARVVARREEVVQC